MSDDKTAKGYQPSIPDPPGGPTTPGDGLDPDTFWAAFRPAARISADTFRDDDSDPSVEPGPIFLRPKTDPGSDDFPVPDEPVDPGGPCSGRPHVRPPLIAAQIRLQLGSLELDCPSTEDQQRIEDHVAAVLGELIPVPQVRVECGDRLLTVAAWPTENDGDACEQQARDRGFAALRLLDGDENFGLFVSSSFISQQARLAFEQGPDRLAANGAPSRSGPIHLTRLRVRFESPNRVKTLVDGFDDRPWPDVGFTLTLSDVIDDDLACSTTSSLDTHGAWKAVLGTALLGRATLFVPLLLPLPFLTLAGGLDAVFNRPDTDDEAGVGCRALGLVPLVIPVPDSEAVSVRYQRSRVTRGGLFFGGTATLADRAPIASLEGPDRLAVEATASSTFGIFRVETDLTFGTISYRWQEETGVVIASPTAQNTKVTFLRGNRTAESPPFTRTVRVIVEDEDGFEATLERPVQISVLPEDELPPVCRVKPHLSKCLPPEQPEPLEPLEP